MAPAKLTDRSTITRITRIKRPRSLARTTRFVETNQAVSTCPVPIQKIFPFPSDANHLLIPRRPVPQRVSSFLRTNWDCRMASMAWFLRNAGVPRECPVQIGRRPKTALKVKIRPCHQPFCDPHHGTNERCRAISRPWIKGLALGDSGGSERDV